METKVKRTVPYLLLLLFFFYSLDSQWRNSATAPEWRPPVTWSNLTSPRRQKKLIHAPDHGRARVRTPEKSSAPRTHDAPSPTRAAAGRVAERASRGRKKASPKKPSQGIERALARSPAGTARAAATATRLRSCARNASKWQAMSHSCPRCRASALRPTVPSTARSVACRLFFFLSRGNRKTEMRVRAAAEARRFVVRGGS